MITSLTESTVHASKGQDKVVRMASLVGLLLTLSITWSGCGAVNCGLNLSMMSSAWDPSPYQCHGRCGQDFPMDQPCACDSLCVVYGDCCADFDIACPIISVGTRNSRTSASAEKAANSNDTSSSSLPSSVDPQPETVTCDLGRARLVSACPTPAILPESSVLYGGRWIKSEKVQDKCQQSWTSSDPPDVLQVLPVTDSASGHHFANIYCMLCHGGSAKHALPWSIAFMWNMIDTQEPAVNPQNLIEVLRRSGQLRVPSTAFPPPGVAVRRCLQLKEFDPVSCSCQSVSMKCLAGPDAYVLGNYHLYRNPACLQCSFMAAGLTRAVILSPDEEDLEGSLNADVSYIYKYFSMKF